MKTITSLAVLTALISIAITSCKTPQPVAPAPPTFEREILGSVIAEDITAKNIIFLIGDGMGIGQISAGTYSNSNTSNLEKLEYVGLHKPHSADNLITDSAAAATAFACGVKTHNEAIGVDKHDKKARTILEEAEERGYKTGLVATSSIVHATPASFIAHNHFRRNYEDIAEDFLDTEVDFFAGGGKKYFDRREKDDRNLIEELKKKGYVIEDQLTDFVDTKIQMEESDKFGYFTADGEPLSVDQGRDYLEPVTMSAINYLNQKAGNDGFFIMIESSQIDWGGHANNSDWIINEFNEFNSLIGKVLAWAEADGETLVVVTADHETGGYTVQPGSKMDSLKTAFTTEKHTGDFIPVFASGPNAKLFTGLYENTAIYHKMREAFGWEKN